MTTLFKKDTSGFTLVELLVVVSLLGILAGVSLSIINPKKQRNVAEDGVRQSNLQKFALGVEAYANANSKYPVAAEMADANSDNVPDGAEVAIFIKKIPNGEPTATAIYTYVSENVTSPTYFGISVPMVGDSTRCFKYHSAWGKIQSCLIARCGGNSGANTCN